MRPKAAGPPRPALPFQNGVGCGEVGLHQCPSEKTLRREAGSGQHVPSHVPTHAKIGARARGFLICTAQVTPETDSLLEED